jgi:predicted membrane-bound spermidine synthase
MYEDERMKRALDLGTGDGSYLLELLEQGYQPTGVDRIVDLYPSNVIKAINDGRIKIVIQDAFEFLKSQQDGFYHLVTIRMPDELLSYIAVSTKHTLPRNSAEFLRHLKRVLSPDGIFVVISYDTDYFSSDDIIRTLALAGFRLEERNDEKIYFAGRIYDGYRLTFRRAY